MLKVSSKREYIFPNQQICFFSKEIDFSSKSEAELWFLLEKLNYDSTIPSLQIFTGKGNTQQAIVRFTEARALHHSNEIKWSVLEEKPCIICHQAVPNHAVTCKYSEEILFSFNKPNIQKIQVPNPVKKEATKFDALERKKQPRSLASIPWYKTQ